MSAPPIPPQSLLSTSPHPYQPCPTGRAQKLARCRIKQPQGWLHITSHVLRLATDKPFHVGILDHTLLREADLGRLLLPYRNRTWCLQAEPCIRHLDLDNEQDDDCRAYPFRDLVYDRGRIGRSAERRPRNHSIQAPEKSAPYLDEKRVQDLEGTAPSVEAVVAGYLLRYHTPKYDRGSRVVPRLVGGELL